MQIETERLLLREFVEADWQAVLRRLGMTLEGRLRESEFMRGRWVDTSLYGILEREWHALRG